VSEYIIADRSMEKASERSLVVAPDDHQVDVALFGDSTDAFAGLPVLNLPAGGRRCGRLLPGGGRRVLGGVEQVATVCSMASTRQMISRIP
jgi:hypothetical protein